MYRFTPRECNIYVFGLVSASRLLHMYVYIYFVYTYVCMYVSMWQAARERAQALELRGRCYMHLGDYELAGNHFRQVRATNAP